MDYALDANVSMVKPPAATTHLRSALHSGNPPLHHHSQGHIFSIDRVKAEMADKGDELASGCPTRS